MGIIEEYGYVPFIALVGAAAVSKEVYLVNEESLLALSTLNFAFCAYVASGDTFAEAVKEHNDETQKRFDKATSAVMTAMRSYKSSLEKQFEEVEVMKEYVTEQHDSAVSFAKFEAVQVKWAAYNEMMLKLNGIQAREESEAALMFTQMCDDVVGNVRAEFAGANAEALKKKTLEYAISNIGKVPDKNDPVTSLFMAQVKKE